MKKIEWEQDQSTFCCGLCEVGHIEYESDQRGWWSDSEFDAPSSEAALKKIRETNLGFPLMFNFIHEVPKEFRDYIQSQKDWKLIHKWKNPNTGNIITCGILINGSNQRWKQDNG